MYNFKRMRENKPVRCPEEETDVSVTALATTSIRITRTGI